MYLISAYRTSARKGLGFLTLATLLAALALALTPIGQAQECSNRGVLDAMYCDADGDLVADAPTDETLKLLNTALNTEPSNPPARYTIRKRA